MADLTVTSADVLAPSGVTAQIGYNAGEAIDAGEVIYLDSTTGTLKLADADGAASSVAVGVSLTTSATGQPVQWVKTDNNLTVSSVLTVGQVYVVSGTAGKIAPYSDLGSGDYVTILGVATSTSNLKLNINASGTQKP
jgi:hypothetical protein